MKKELIKHSPMMNASGIRRIARRSPKKNKPVSDKTSFPVIQMPEQPTGFLKANRYDCY